MSALAAWLRRWHDVDCAEGAERGEKLVGQRHTPRQPQLPLHPASADRKDLPHKAIS